MNFRLPMKTFVKHFTLLLVLLSMMTSGLKAQQVQSEVEQLFCQFKRAARFDYNFPREKVYVHFDNLGYLVGDTIWYKAYVVRASSLKPTQLSRVLYVELLNADGQMITQNIHRLDSMSTANGMFSLQLPVYAGYYEVRAYTREMVNWNERACFSRIIPVFSNSNPNMEVDKTQLKDIVQLSIPEPLAHERVTLGDPRPYVMKNDRSALLNFYPEGGQRVKGAQQRIAYKLTDGKGSTIEDTLEIYDHEGHLYTTSVPEHEGMGTFDLAANFKEGYVRLSSNRKFYEVDKKVESIALPTGKVPYALQADYAKEGELIQVIVGDSLRESSKLLGLAVFNRENVCYFDTLTVSNESVELLIPHKALRGGVCRAELFDALGNSLATRLFWVPIREDEKSRYVKLQVKQNQKWYGPFSPIVLQMRAVDALGRSVKGANMSVAVRDEGGNFVSTNDGGFDGNMLLASELKGYIHRPDLYFIKNDAAHRRMLDLLMMVQGWQTNTFEVMCGKDSFQLKQPIENKLILRGRIYKDNKKHEPLANATLKMYGYRLQDHKITGEAIEGETRTNSKGEYAFESNVDFEGNYVVKFVMKQETGKRTFTRLMIDRWFSPQPRPLWHTDLALPIKPITTEDFTANPKDITTFEWIDTLQRAVSSTLNPAEVVARVRKYKGLNGSKYTWGGGETTGIKNSMKYINISRELERSKDCGGPEFMEVADLLQYSNNRIQHDKYGVLDMENLVDTLFRDDFIYNSPNRVDANAFNHNPLYGNNIRRHFYINGHEIRVYENNIKVDYDYLYADCGEYKSVAMVIDNKVDDALSGDEKRFSYTAYAIYLYSNPDRFRFRETSKKGIEVRNVQGFTPNVRFYSPNYRRFDLPTDKDNRRTLLWAPNVTTDNNGKATVILFSNSHEAQRIDVSVRGITKDGVLIDWN